MSTTTMPYFKLDSGQFLSETMGLPNAEVGLYIKMMALYWEHGCKLPTKDLLILKLHSRTKKEKESVEGLLNLFFPNNTHERLDEGLKEAQGFSKLQAERAKSGHEKRKAHSANTVQTHSDEGDPDDF